MKTLSGNATTAANRALGEDPLTLLAIEWSSGTRWYATRDLEFRSAKGSILSHGSLTAQAKANSSGAVGEMSFTLSDSEGDLKALIDTCCAEGTKATVYECFASAMTEDDLIVLLRGVIVSPEWSEAERTLSLSVETKVKDQEVGFAIEQADYEDLVPDEPLLTDEAIGKAWPLCFGSILHAPALKLFAPPETFLNGTFKTGDNSFTVEDATKFPENVAIDVIIDGMVFKVQVVHATKTMHVGEPNVPKYQNIGFATRDASDPDYPNPWVAWIDQDVSLANTFIYFVSEQGNTVYHRVLRQEGRKIWVDNRIVQKSKSEKRVLTSLAVPNQLESARYFDNAYGIAPVLLGPPTVIKEVARYGRDGWGIEMSYMGANTSSSAVHVATSSFRDVAEVISSVPWKFAAGTSVKLWANPSGSGLHPVKYIVNQIPSTQVRAVFAWRRNPRTGTRTFTPIPASYYTVNLSESLFGQTATTVTLKQPLSEYYGQGWEDAIYVSFKSSVGPNVADVIEWLLETYSDIEVDAASFSSVHSACANYPISKLQDSKVDVVALCEDIAWKSRCGLLIEDGSAKLKYLSVEPSPDDAVDEDVIENKSLLLTNTRIEDIITHFRAFWKKDHSGRPGSEQVLSKVENVARFGLIKRDFTFDTFNVKSLVEKSATFWAHRYANAWRKAKATFLSRQALAYEMFDCIQLDLGILGPSVKGVIESHTFDSGDEAETSFGHSIWLPWLAGTTSQDARAWLSDAGDTLPPDPVDQLNTTTIDEQWADDLSRSFVQNKPITRPAKIINESADRLGFNVDVYDDGYEDVDGTELPPTNRDLSGNRIPFVAYPTDLAMALDRQFPVGDVNVGAEKYRNILQPGTKIQIFSVHGARWMFNVPADRAHVLGKINGPTLDALGRIGVTLYPNGFDASTAQTEVKAYYAGSDVGSAAVGDRGLLLQHGDVKVFFPLGGSGSSTKVFKVLFNNGDGSYEGQEYDRPGGTPTGPDDVFLIENNYSDNVPAGEVDGKYVDGTLRPDGNYWFNYDAGDCDA